ncbi:zinc finger-containing ubiquitin peptidase 1-like isoform X2 [Anthonomus grandis grandis]|uniref:zinc finger-containing ubiquitin peptidase 1-like isoform X2 n=1 Tax=Anthonomus grandis grandis TaxID=2921223 RepID=UPI00216628BF|nr:zinc finger-containing ubiquitin peptidase 1-like isoform X2 [Anthonomus grandis grandis]
MASNCPDFSYCCEICGLEGLSEDEFRSHTHNAHVEGFGVCPFCELTAANPAELIIHVNQAHLDFLTPESENTISFIDDPSPSEYNGFNGESSVTWNNPATYSSNRSLNGEKLDNKSTYSNINLSPKVNGGGELTPKNSSHGEGSPLRSGLALKLKSASPALQCPMCNYTSGSPSDLEEHVNRRHFDLTSPSVGSMGLEECYSCPLCVKSFRSAPDLELHVNIEHKDVLSPASPSAYNCPVCGLALDRESDGELAQQHVDSHFTAGSPQPCDRAALRERERKEFEMLRAQYGMDNQGNFREQSVTNMQRAVYAGEMSVADYYERQLDLKAAESSGVDDGNSVTRSMVPRVKAMSANSQSVTRTLLCTCVDHYASSYGDRGWGCGYRNTQMIISSLLTHTGYNERLYKLWQKEKPPRSSVPSISRLQSLIEQAWSQGFDIQGSEQLGCKLVNTRKWIGATEVVTLLSFLRIRCQLVDFHRPTGPGGSHPELFKWVLNYFESSAGGEFTAPLYLQHQGHSRTIMGIEVHRDGSLVLLVLDPSHSPQQMAQLGDTSATTAGAFRLLRKSEAAMKAKQYQIVGVIGTIDNEQQYQVGDDVWGPKYIENLKTEKVNVDHVKITENCSSGIAQIIVADSGMNQIVIVAGANSKLSLGDIEEAKELIKSAKVLVLQLETPVETAIAAMKLARGISILNGAPALSEFKEELIKLPTIFCVNESEASTFTGLPVNNELEAVLAAKFLITKGCQSVLITLGEQGAIYLTNDPNKPILKTTAPKVTAMDTTGAGDAFIGALAHCLANSCDMEEAIQFACGAASDSVTRLGTQISFPDINMLKEAGIKIV